MRLLLFNENLCRFMARNCKIYNYHYDYNFSLKMSYYNICLNVVLKCTLKYLKFFFLKFLVQVWLHDVRVANHHIATLAGHTQEVCGMAWSPENGRVIATGSYI